MINYNNIAVRRIIMHHIIAKLPIQEHATINYEDELFRVEQDVVDIIKKRLIDSAGKESKAFELEIDRSETGTFFLFARI